MRVKDIEQALLLEEKVRLHATYLMESGASGVIEPDGAEAFLTNFGSYRELITDDCDTVEITRRVFHTIQEICQLASNLYKAATGYELPARSFSSVGERHSEQYQSPKLPMRAETFGGFDERRQKQQQQHQLHYHHQPQYQSTAGNWHDAILSTVNNTAISLQGRDNHQEKRDSYSWNETDNLSTISAVSSLNASTPTTLNVTNTAISNNSNISATASNNNVTTLSKDPNYEALQVSHHLHTLLCIINQQMTTIDSLYAQFNSLRENPKSMYRHNDQLEELRNLQDKLQEEKTEWLKRREQEEKDLTEQKSELEALKTKIRAEQIDIEQQRDELHKKMQILSNQGILSSSNVALSPTSIVCSSDEAGYQSPHTNIGASCSNLTVDDHTDMGGNLIAENRRKDKWRSASSKYIQI